MVFQITVLECTLSKTIFLRTVLEFFFKKIKNSNEIIKNENSNKIIEKVNSKKFISILIK